MSSDETVSCEGRDSCHSVMSSGLCVVGPASLSLISFGQGLVSFFMLLTLR